MPRPRPRNPDHAIQVRFSIAQFELIEEYRREHRRIPALGTAVRALVDEALENRKDRRAIPPKEGMSGKEQPAA
jgi:hypothetical protein